MLVALTVSAAGLNLGTSNPDVQAKKGDAKVALQQLTDSGIGSGALAPYELLARDSCAIGPMLATGEIVGSGLAPVEKPLNFVSPRVGAIIAQDLSDVAEEVLEARVGAARTFGVVEVGEQARAGQRHLEDAVGPLPRVEQLRGREGALAAELPDDGDRRALDLQVAELVGMPLAPQERVEVPLAEALDRVEELALERQAALLPVGDDGQARCLLRGDDLVDRAVLDALEVDRRERAPVAALAGDEQRLGTQQAADDVRAHGAERGDVTGVCDRHSIRPSVSVSPPCRKPSSAPVYSVRMSISPSLDGGEGALTRTDVHAPLHAGDTS